MIIQLIDYIDCDDVKDTDLFNGQAFVTEFADIALYLWKLYSSENCKFDLKEKLHPTLYMMYTIGLAFLPRNEIRPIFNKGYIRLIQEISCHIQKTNKEKMNNIYDRAYHTTTQSGVRVIHFGEFEMDPRVCFIKMRIFYTDFYKECKSLFPNTQISLYDYGVSLVLSETANSQPINDYGKNQSQYIIIRYALTPKYETNDFLLSSHIPLHESDFLAQNMNEHKRWKYLKKIQLDLEFSEGVAYWGSTCHSIHKTVNEKMCFFYILKLEGQTNNVNAIKQREWPIVNYDFYGVNFKWISSMDEFEEWNKKYGTFDAEDIFKTINIFKMIQIDSN